MTPEKLKELKEKYPTLEMHLITVQGQEEVVLRAPDKVTFKRFRAQMQDEKKKLDASELLVRACMLHPDSAGFDAMLEHKPGLVETLLNVILDLAGMEKEPEKKVL
jgi:hypothetical protein